MVDAVARAAGVPAKDVRRAVMLRGDLGVVASAALAGGAAALAGFRLEVGRPVLPMLAQTADSVDAALAKLDASADNPAAVEWKLDGRADPGAPQADPTSRSTRGRWTTSPPGCPRWSRPRSRCR
jgi:ATP-dependent DNA ligase